MVKSILDSKFEVKPKYVNNIVDTSLESVIV